MRKASRNNKLFQSLKKKINEIDSSLLIIEKNIEKLDKKEVWNSEKSIDTIKKLNKLVDADKDLNLLLTEVYDSNTIFNIKF